jgi:hypothetical protein
MLDRCEPNHKSRKYYYEKGVTVSARWRFGEGGKSGPQCFVEDMGPRPSSKHSLDRYPDFNGPYEKANCRWATIAQQNNNQRSNVLIWVDGHRMTIAEASETYGIPWSTLRNRLRVGEPVEEALDLPWPPQSSIDSAVRHLQKRMAEIAAA